MRLIPAFGSLTVDRGPVVCSGGGVRMGPREGGGNVARRGISLAEASTVLKDPLSTTFPDRLTPRARCAPEDRHFPPRTPPGCGAHGAKRHHPHHQRPASNEARTRIL
jgi:hypothetical protein